MIQFEENFKRRLEGCMTFLDFVPTLSMSKFQSILNVEYHTYVQGESKDRITATHLMRSSTGSMLGYLAPATEHDMRGRTPTYWEEKDRGESGCPAGQSIFPARADNNSLTGLKGINPEQTTPQQTITRFLPVTDVGRKGTKNKLPQKDQKNKFSPTKGIVYLCCRKDRGGDVKCSNLLVVSDADLTTVHPDLIPKSLQR